MDYKDLVQKENVLQAMRKCPILSKDNRTALRAVIEKIQDKTRSVKAKISALSEEYNTLNANEVISKDETKLKALTKEMYENIDKAILGFDDTAKLEIKPVVGVGTQLAFDKDENPEIAKIKAAYWGLYAEFEGILFEM